MRSSRLVVTVLVIIGLLALAFVQVQVPDVNDQTNAIAYTQPEVKSSYGASASSGGVLGIKPVVSIASVSSAINLTVQKYEHPAPVMKPLWQALFAPATTFAVNPPAGIPRPPGTTCTDTLSDSSPSTAQTRARLEVLEPGGRVTNYTTDAVNWTVSERVISSKCSDGSTTITVIQTGPEVRYDVGTYYFTKGFGDYRFTVYIELMGGAAPVVVGKTVKQISVTQASL